MNCHMYLTEEKFYLFSLFSLVYQKGHFLINPCYMLLIPKMILSGHLEGMQISGGSHGSVRTRQILATRPLTTMTCWDVSLWVGTGSVLGREDGLNKNPELDKWHKSLTKLFCHVSPNTPSSFSCMSFLAKLLPGNNISFLFFFMEIIEKLCWYNEQFFGLGHNEMQVRIILGDKLLCGVFVHSTQWGLHFLVFFLWFYCFSFCCLLDLSDDIPLEISAQLEIPTS